MPDLSNSYRFQTNRIRDKFLTEVKKNNYLYHEIDVHQVSTDEWAIERFILEYKNEEKVHKGMIETMAWKKDFGAYDRTDAYFPREFFEVGDPELYGRDYKGRYIAWLNIRVRNQVLITEMITLVKQYSLHFSVKFDHLVHRNGYINVTCMSGTENYNMRKNFSMELTKFSMKLKKYFPLLYRGNLLVDMPKTHATFAKWFTSLYQMAANVKDIEIRYISGEQLSEFVDSELIPMEMGGPRLSNIVVADNLKPLTELEHLKYSDKAIEKFYKYFNTVKDNMKKFRTNIANGK